MVTLNVKVLRDGSDIRWIFDPMPGLEAFGWVTEHGRFVVEGKHAGQVVMDWIRDKGIEPVIVR